MTARHLGEQVGSGRRHHDQIGLARQADVADLALVVEIEQLGEDAIVAERADRERRDELLRRPGHHHAHGDAALAQPPDQVEALVGGDAAADDQQHPMAGGDCFTGSSPSRSDAALARHVGAHAVGGLERNAVALAQLGHQMAVVDGGHTELAGRDIKLGEETLDLAQQLPGCSAHVGILWGIAHQSMGGV